MLAVCALLPGPRASAQGNDDAEALNAEVMRLYQQGRYGEAIPLAQRAVAIQEKAFGPGHPAVADSLNNLGFLYYQSGDYARAEPLLKRAIAIQESAFGPEHPGVADSVNNLAALYWTQGDYARAEALYSRALAIREKAFGPEHPAVVPSLNNLALLYHTLDDYARAEPLYERALAIQEKAFGPEHPDVAQLLNNIAGLYDEKGDYARAEPLFERALAIREKALGPEHPGVAESLNNLAALHREKGDYARAEPLFERTIAIREKVFGPEHPLVADALDSLALLYHATGDYARAEPLHERALAIQEKAFGPEHPDVAMSLNNLAGLYHTKGDYARAEPLHKRALAIREKVFGPEHSAVAESLNNLAALYQAKGDLARAEPLYERTLAIQEKVVGPEHPRVAASLANLAVLYVSKGDYARAEALLKRALAIREKVLGPEHPGVAWSLNDLAALYHTEGDHARAEPLYVRALTIREKVFGSENPDVAKSLTNLAALYQTKGEHARAEPLLKRALAIQEKIFGPGHPDVAWSLNNLGFLYVERGDHARAEPLLKRAVAIREKVLGPEHLNLALSLMNLAMIYEVQGDRQQTMAFLGRALEIEERQISLILPTGSEDQARAFMATLSGSTSVILSLQRLRPEEPSTTHLALTTVLRRKGRVLDVISGSLEALREQAGPEERETLDALLSRRDALARRVLRGPGKTPLAEHRKALEALRGEVEALEREAYRRGGVLRAVATPVQLEDVQAQIPANAALVEMVAYTMFDPAPAPGASVWGARHFAAFVLRREGLPRWVSLGEAEPTLERVHGFRQALQDPGLPPALLRRHARGVYDRLIAPIAPLLEGVEMLLLAPEGQLNLIPFGALVDATDRYLIEHFTLTYLTSGRDLLRLAAPRSSQSTALVVAAPDYDASLRVTAAKARGDDEPAAARRSSEFGELRFQPLPGTRKEAEAIEKALGVRALTGNRATEAALKRAQGPRVLHVATHGFFLPDQAFAPRNPSGIRAQSPGPDASASPFALAPPTGENPLLRSGLALAGANQLESGAQDGILTALEMATLDLWGTKLVVLSACETGLGEVAVGEGVYGLRRALVIAGAEAQLMSLWRVDDVATRELMTAYYQRLVAGEGRAEALRRVQLEMLKDRGRRRPLYWAGFIPIGAWGPLAPAAASASRE